ncbi:hypothetical protein [Rathayibacter sp. AY1A7]|uniref:hypothetical protein n=1 Tax=Rathayibacter sp. AY1A7 TaxID=2080524 RepID=UPI000CE90C9D|nr:hypothetical protein [Rathayibacter sp. AY1A7]PPF21039.1 hypothetical protein C5B95_06410 [Rathayibacter sp. AY1A7]
MSTIDPFLVQRNGTVRDRATGAFVGEVVKDYAWRGRKAHWFARGDVDGDSGSPSRRGCALKLHWQWEQAHASTDTPTG